MLKVKTPEEALTIILEMPLSVQPAMEEVPLSQAHGRILFAPLRASEYVPGFDRSSVDGYAVHSSDTFGCSDAIPAILTCSKHIRMGETAQETLRPGECAAVPTGGAVPPGADAVVMIEYTEDYGDGTVGILKSAAPGMNMVYRGDDVFPGKQVLPSGRKLNAGDIGALAAMGCMTVCAARKPLIGIISTGDELVSVDETPEEGMVRDVNSAMLAAAVSDAGGVPVCYGIVPDQEEVLRQMLEKALHECSMVLISGGSSVGEKDVSERIMEEFGEILFHGIAMKPGKPTILASADGKPVFGLPGHPGAAYLVSQLFVKPMIGRLLGKTAGTRTIPAVLKEAVSANHGRAQYMGVSLQEENGTLYAVPIHSKSGLITGLSGSDGFFGIPRDCEGIPAGQVISVRFYSED